MKTDLSLNAHEARVLGVLIEKERTTPEQYPLSLNAAVLGANQKSNRDPVVDYSEAEVVVALQGLVAKHLAGRVMPAGSRVEKFRHNARETLGLGEAETAVLAELLMRGAQQPGELRTRASRMTALPTPESLQTALDALAGKGLVRNLGRRSGERAERWDQVVAPAAGSGEIHAHAVALAPADSAARAGAGAATLSAGATTPGVGERLSALEARVAQLENKLADLGG